MEITFSCWRTAKCTKQELHIDHADLKHGFGYIACNLGYHTTDVHKWTCLKVIFLGPDGKNLTTDIYDPANHNCSANTTMVSYTDYAGHCVINGRHNPYETCKCQHPEPCGPDCTCTKDLTFLQLMNRSMMFLAGKE